MNPPAFLFAPGAGAPSSHPWMAHWSQLLSTIGPVTRLDYSYMLEKRGRPDPLPKLIAAHRTALASLRQAHRGPIILIGKSMGGRVGCHLSLEENVAAVVCLGYPLCGGGDPAKLRDEVLLAMKTPLLLVQGTRDSLCPLELLDKTRASMTTQNELHIVEGGDHSLLVTKSQLKSSGETQQQVDQRTLAAIQTFIQAAATPDPA